MKIRTSPNTIISWAAFSLSLLIFLFTLSKTVNFWDCGELIACADTLQTAHAPGAPFYLLLARFFAMFAINPSHTALAVNLLSALASAFAVYFTYHTIQIISLRVLNNSKYNSLFKNEKQIKYLSYFSALIGSLALAFSTSFWASAIEAEVYAVSIFFTALTVWILLKFTQVDQKDKNRWLILAALIIGISTGVHLLNILIIPALVFIYYFDKKQISRKGFFINLGISFGLLGFVQLCISGIPVMASKFELFFANDLNAGYNTGLYVFAIFIILALIVGIYVSGIRKKPILNLIITAFAVFITGYSSYTIILIRSAANPSLDQSNPETIFNFISYLNREEYGNRPLWYGQQYNSEFDKINPYVEGEPIYDTVGGKYQIVSYKPEENFEKKDKTILPRMWSRQPEHIAAYEEWTHYRRKEIPSFGVNLSFMFRYQFSHMYFRYFMWNFVGKQNDFQSHGGPVNGNWISGIAFFDNLRLSQTKELAPQFENNKGRNAYYLLPLILGIIGLIIQFKTDKKYLFVISLIFVFTGIAIAFYLNQNPYQARERDYSYVGSFYAFAIWIGLGVSGVFLFIRKYFKHKLLLPATALACFIAVPLQFVIKNYNDHNNHNNDFAWHFAYNMLNSCEKNAILFVSGDNETFPLWYLQESEHIRTDVRVVNLSFLNNDWYIDQITKPTEGSPGIIISQAKDKYISGQRDFIPVKVNPYLFIEDIYKINSAEIDSDYRSVFEKFLNLLKESGYAEKYKAEYLHFADFYSKIQPHGANRDFRDFCSVVYGLEDSVQCAGYGISQYDAKVMVSTLRGFINKQLSYPAPLDKTLDFVFSDDTSTRIQTKLYDYPIDYFPSKAMMLPINKKQVLSNFGEVQLREDYLVDNMIWNPERESFTKSDLMLLEIIRSNDWKRPVYFSSVMNSTNYLGLEKYLYLEGLTYRLIPIETEVSADDPLNVNPASMYENLTQNFDWGNLSKNNEYLDENSRKILVSLRGHYSRLARGLYFAGAIKQSEQMLNECVKLIPNNLIPFDYYMVGVAHGYYRINKFPEAGVVSIITAKNALAELEFYNKFPVNQRQNMKLYQQRALKTIEELYLMAEQFKNKELLKQIKPIYDRAKMLYDPGLN